MVNYVNLAEHSRRLGRHVEHDERSRAHRPKTGSVVSVDHVTHGLPLDQGQIGSCTANALIGALDSDPNYKGKSYVESDAVKLYGRETSDEGQPYPPNDPGGSGLAVCKAAVELGLISSYSHAFSVDEALGALALRPVITGVNWYSSMDSPDSNGLVTVGGQIRGGHEIVAVEIVADKQLVGFMNSWGPHYGVGGKFYLSFADWARLLSEQGDVTVPQP